MRFLECSRIFKRKKLTVLAWRLGFENPPQWADRFFDCGAFKFEDEATLAINCNTFEEKAKTGDWVVLTELGAIRLYEDASFTEVFEEELDERDN